jgi:PPM family protein phosphatase
MMGTPVAHAPPQPTSSWRDGDGSRGVAAHVAVVAFGQTDPGRVREHNEDFIALAPEHSLYLVADGMGGHASGDVASRLAAKCIRNYFDATRDGSPDEPRHPDDGDAAPPARRLAAAIRKANRDVHEISTSHERHKGMGSTVVAIHLVGDVAHIAHVGDSRCYRVRGGALEQLTRDHSLHNEALALKPDLSPERLAKLPKNVVTRALGMAGAVKVELGCEKIESGDLFLLCSDGLTGMVPDDEIIGLLELSEDLEESCHLLIAMANEAGGRDNISVVLVRVTTPEREEPEPPSTDPIEPRAIIVVSEKSHEEQLAREEAWGERQRRIEESLLATTHLPPCGGCGAPVLDGNYFCFGCGREIP